MATVKGSEIKPGMSVRIPIGYRAMTINVAFVEDWSAKFPGDPKSIHLDGTNGSGRLDFAFAYPDRDYELV